MDGRHDYYSARVCWNSKNWVCPSGEAKRAEQGTYAQKYGFGHEEWLFNLEWVLDGWKYSYLQPITPSRDRLADHSIALELYSILPDAQRFYVGHLRSCDVLPLEAGREAATEFKRRGWLNDMAEQVRAVGGDDRGLEDPDWIFNVRYRPAAAVLYEAMVRPGSADPIWKNQRYMLLHRTERASAIERQWARRAAASSLRPTGTQTRVRTAARDRAELVHNQLQNELFGLLVKDHGRDAVEMERDFIDIKVRHADGVDLYEVKSDPRPIHAIREAVGQLLAYAFHCEQDNETVREVIVAAPGELQDRDRFFLEYLRTSRRIPVRYQCVRRGSRDRGA